MLRLINNINKNKYTDFSKIKYTLISGGSRKSNNNFKLFSTNNNNDKRKEGSLFSGFTIFPKTITNKSTTLNTNNNNCSKELKIDEIIGKINRVPNSCELYEELGLVLGENEKTNINGKQFGQLDIILKQIEINETYPDIFFKLYNRMVQYENLNEIKLFNGTTMTLQEILIKSMGLNPTNYEIQLTVASNMDDSNKETIDIVAYKYNESTKKLDMFKNNVTKSDIVLNLFNIDSNRRESWLLLEKIVNENQIDSVSINQDLTLDKKTIYINSWLLNKHQDLFTTLHLFNSLGQTERLTLSNGLIITKSSILLEALNSFKGEPDFYKCLATCLTNNHQKFKLQDMEVGRIPLMIQAIQLEKLKPEPQYLLFIFYHLLGTYMDKDDLVELEEDGKHYNKTDLFNLSLELNQNYYHSQKELIKFLSIMEIKNEQDKELQKQIVGLCHSIINNAKSNDSSIMILDAYKSLLNYYSTISVDKIKLGEYTQIYQSEKLRFKSILIQACNQVDNSNSFYELGNQISNDELVEVRDIQMNKKDLFLKAIDIDPKYKDAKLELSKLLSQESPTIVLLNGQTKSKVQLLHECDLTNYQVCFELSKCDDPNEHLKYLGFTISLNPLYAPANLKLAQYLLSKSKNDIKIIGPADTNLNVIGEFFITRKQLFINSLNKEYPLESDSDISFARYNLSMEMDDKEISLQS